MMKHEEIYSAAQLTALIHEVGFLPLLDSGIRGFSAEEMVADDCRYVVLDDGGGTGRCGSGKVPSWSLLTTPETLMGRDGFRCSHTPEESYQQIISHFRALLPNASDKQLQRLIG